MNRVTNTRRPYCRYCCLESNEPLVRADRCEGNALFHYSCLRHNISRTHDSVCKYCRTHFNDHRIGRYNPRVRHRNRLVRFALFLLLIAPLILIGITTSNQKPKPFEKSIICNSKSSKFSQIKSKMFFLEDKPNVYCDECGKLVPDFDATDVCDDCLAKLKIYCTECEKQISIRNRNNWFIRVYILVVMIALISSLIKRRIRSQSIADKFKNARVITLESCLNELGEPQRKLRISVSADGNEALVQQIEDNVFRDLFRQYNRHSLQTI